MTSRFHNKGDVFIQDQTTPPLDLFFIQAKSTPITLTAPVVIGDRVFNVTSATDIVVGDYFGVFSGVSGEGRFFFAEVISVVSLAITVDTPVDFPFQASDIAASFTRDLNVVGTAGAPQTFSVQAGGVGSGIIVDITRIMLTMVLASAPDDGLFGDIAKLTNGLVLRRVDGETRNIFNAKDNGELANLAFDLVYTSRTVPPSSSGLRMRYTFAGQDKHGVALRLMPGDSLEAIVQDSLSALTSFRMLAAGHIAME